MDKLTIFWHDKTANSFYWVLDEKKSADSAKAIHNLEGHELLKADLACLADCAQNKKVELVLSSNDVHFNHVNLPNKAQRHLRKAVPFLLEEQLSESVDDVFIAIGNRQKDQLIPVRAINLNYLQELLDTFEAAEIVLDRVRVDLDMLPPPESGFKLAVIDEVVLIVDDRQQQWSCYQEDFVWILQRIIEQRVGDDVPVAIGLEIVADDQQLANEIEELLPIGHFIPKITVVDSVREELAHSTQPVLNLLQGEFETKSDGSPIKGVLVKVASIIGIIFAAHLLHQGTQLFSLSAQAESLNEQKVGLWKQAFPGRKVPSNQDRELRTYMKSLEGGQGDGAFLAMLSSSSALISDLNKLYPTNISYSAQRSELRLDLVAVDLPILNQYRDDLKNNGFEVEMSSATQRGEGYSTRLVIRRK